MFQECPEPKSGKRHTHRRSELSVPRKHDCVCVRVCVCVCVPCGQKWGKKWDESGRNGRNQGLTLPFSHGIPIPLVVYTRLFPSLIKIYLPVHQIVTTSPLTHRRSNIKTHAPPSIWSSISLFP